MLGPKRLSQQGWKFLLDGKTAYAQETSEGLWVKGLAPAPVCVASPVWQDIIYPLNEYRTRYQNTTIPALLLYVHLNQYSLDTLPSQIQLDPYRALLTMNSTKLADFISTWAKLKKANKDRGKCSGLPLLRPLVDRELDSLSQE